MDLFTLKGTVSVDTSDVNAKLDALAQKVQSLKQALNGLNSAGGATGYTGTSGPVAIIPTTTTTGSWGTTSGKTSTTGTGTTGTGTTGTGTTGTGTTTNQSGTYGQTVAAQLGSKKLGFGTTGAVYLGQALWRLTERAAGAAVSFGKTGISYNETMEKYEKMIGSYLNEDDPAKVKEFVKSIEQFAIETPLSMEGAMTAAIKTLQSGVAPENLIETLRMFGDMALGDTSKMESIAYVYGQVMSGGKLQGDDTRQFKNAFVNIHELLAEYYSKQTGEEVTTADVAEMQKDGAISAEDVHNAMMMSTQEGGQYYNKMAVMMATLFGQKQKLSDLYSQTAGAVMAEPTDVMKEQILPGLSAILTDVKTWAEENPETLRDVAEGVGDTVITLADTVASVATGAAEFYSENREAADASILLGGLALFKSGHPLLGAASLLFGYGDTKKQLEEHGEELYEESMSPDEGTNSSVVRLTMPDDLEEKLDNGVAYEDLSEEEQRYVDRARVVAGLEQRLLDLHAHSPLGKILRLDQEEIDALYAQIKPREKGGTGYTTPAEVLEGAKSQFEGATGADAYDADQEAFLLESRYSLLGLPDNVVADMQAMWDAYRAAKQGGYEFDSSGYEQRIYSGLYPFYGQYTDDDNVVKEQADLNLATLLEYMSRLSPDREDLPENWFIYDHADDPWYNPGGGGGNPYDFPAPTSSTNTEALIAALQGLAQAYNPDAIAAAVEGAIIRGMSGVTIEQGNVILSPGVIAGTLTPILNQKFGALLGRASRG